MKESVNVMFTHMNSNKGIKLFVERAIAAMIKEFKKLDEGEILGNPVVIPFNPDELTDAEMREEIETANLIKEELNGIIKGITYANGSNKKICLKREKVWHH